MQRHTTIDSRLGQLTLVADDEVLTGVYFPDHSPAPVRHLFGQEVDFADDELLLSATRQIWHYLDGELTHFELPTRAAGTPLQERVWALMREVPYGETTSYGSLAKALGNPGLARMVGSAVGRNPLCIVDPCHRVLGADGSLVGYAGGLARKRELLELEGSL
jgi:methylated-DNA-[protein]-cysteine S-methyltransferase